MCRHTPQQNGVAERKNRNILEVAKAMLNEKHMPMSYWAETTHTTVYLMNRCTTSRVQYVTLHEKYDGKKPDLSYVPILCSNAYVHIPNEKRQKLDP